ncbi:MAG: hypothetical protein ACUVRH_00750 [Candidatus Bipolaricaulia bacterium]
MKGLILSVLVSLLVAVASCSVSAAQAREVGLKLGIGVKVPLVVFAQLRLPGNLAVEAGLAGTGPGIFTAKLYTRAVELFELALRPFIGAGVAVVIFPWGIVTGPFVLSGLEYPLPKTPLSLFGEVGLAWESLAHSSIHLGTDLGMRLDFF